MTKRKLGHLIEQNGISVYDEQFFFGFWLSILCANQKLNWLFLFFFAPILWDIYHSNLLIHHSISIRRCEKYSIVKAVPISNIKWINSDAHTRNTHMNVLKKENKWNKNNARFDIKHVFKPKNILILFQATRRMLWKFISKKKINTMNARGRESEKKLRKGATHRYHWLYVIKYPENLIKKRDFLWSASIISGEARKMKIGTFNHNNNNNQK